MKIAISVEKKDGLNSKVYGHFGRAPSYALYDDATEQLEFIDSKNKHEGHGSCHSTNMLSARGVNAIICGGMGKHAFVKFHEKGIKVYNFSHAISLNELIQKWKNNELREMSIEEVCSGYGVQHHGEHGMCHHGKDNHQV